MKQYRYFVDMDHINWPSGRSEEIGTIYGRAIDVAADYSRPFFCAKHMMSMFFYLEDVGQVVVGFEYKYLKTISGYDKSDPSSYNGDNFFAVYVDKEIGAESMRKCADFLTENATPKIKLNFYLDYLES